MLMLHNQSHLLSANMRAKEFIVEYNEENTTEEYHGLHMKIKDDGYEVVTTALDDWGNEMGSVVFMKGDGNELDPQDLLVIDKYRGLGVAKVMYDFTTSHGYEIHKSYDVTKMADQGKQSGEYFWKKNRGEKRVWEDVNPDIYHSDFKHEVEIGDYRYTAETDNNSGYGNQLIIKVYDGNREIANAEFIEEPHDKALISANTWVQEEYEGQGIATNMYAYAKMLGNDIIPSWNQTDAGERMWRSWNQSGQSKHILPKGHKGYN